MNIVLDDQMLFDEHQVVVEVESPTRATTERTVTGLNGVLSIDLGSRSRKIRQRGVLRAKSRTQMNEKISRISAYMDGNTHRLITNYGEEFDNLRMDVFKVTNERTSGEGLVCEYEIIYTQLRVD